MTTTAQARPSLAEGFSNSVFDSQSTFRSAMEALARPGRIRPIGADILPDAPLLPSAAGLILALCDFETPLYLSPHLAALPGVAAFLRFHSGVPLVAEPSRATFALLDLAHDRLDLGSFAQGTPEYPDRSTTIIACWMPPAEICFCAVAMGETYSTVNSCSAMASGAGGSTPMRERMPNTRSISGPSISLSSRPISGPNNRMFYFLSKGSRADSAGDYHSKYLVKQPQAMTGIGLDKAFRILELKP
jgi:hypothetical protein